MNKIVKYISIVRNNWKKSTFACVVLGYGAKYGHDKYEVHNMMRSYCEEAALLGDAPSTAESDSNHIAVILNPAANRRSAKNNFEKYCAPLLYLSGAYVTIVETTHEGHAKKLTDQLNPKTTAVLVAGGDGTVSETVTGLMRDRSETIGIPIGILPLGKYNTLASRLFGTSPNEVERMASATMAVLRGKTKKFNAYRVETLDGGGSEKAVYGVGWIEWGTWPWVKKRVKELWYCGPLRNYIPLLWPVRSALNPTVSASLTYTPPCAGCSRCFEQRPDLMANDVKSQAAKAAGKRWWSSFVKTQPIANSAGINYKTIYNEACNHIERKTINVTGLRLSTNMIHDNYKNESSEAKPPPSLVISLGDKSRYQGQLLFQGLKYLNGEPINSIDLIHAKQLEIRPQEISDKDKMDDSSSEVFLIDNEEFELRPIRITVLPNSLTVFCQ